MSESTDDAERWLPVPGYEGYYEVSNHGRVQGVERLMQHSNGRIRRYKRKILTPNIRHDGNMPYPTVVLAKECKHTRYAVHTLVLMTFVGPRPDDKEARHLDNNPANNRLSNLMWATHAANESDKHKFGTHHQANKTHCPRNHRLQEPNLVAWHMRNGGRRCKSCYRASVDMRVAKSRKLPFDFDKSADAYYERFMSATTRCS